MCKANSAILISGGAANGAAPNSEDGARGVTIAKVGQGLAECKVPTVVAGAAGAEQVNGPLSAARLLTVKGLATVTNANKKSGQANIVLRVTELTQGM